MEPFEITHSPQDCIYGPLTIPSYCWKIIDTLEFQVLRRISQLSTVSYVFPSANHTRLEHSLGCCHLACKFIERIHQAQPKLEIKEEYVQSVVIAALCHTLGCGPFPAIYNKYAREKKKEWTPEEMSTKVLRYIVNKYNLDFDKEVIDAACQFILGEKYEKYPKWLSQIVNNQETAIDIVKLDYLSRDSNRSLNPSKFEYDRLIFNCRVIDDKLAWKLSEMPTIEYLFYSMNDMHLRVYKHRVVQSIQCMIEDIFYFIEKQAKLEEALDDPEIFSTLSDEILYQVEIGLYGKEAQEIATNIAKRILYKCVGEIKIKPDDNDGVRYSQSSTETIANDMSYDLHKVLRIVPMQFQYGISKTKHPLLTIPFWKKESMDKIIYLKEDEISCIVPAHFTETAMRIFVSDESKLKDAKTALAKWIEKNSFIK